MPSVNFDDLSPEVRRRLKLRKQRQSQFSKDKVHSMPIRCLGPLADLTRDQRRRVLQHAMKLNQI